MCNKKRLKYWFSIVLLSIIGTLLFISFFGEINFNFQALEFTIGLQIFDHGFTEIKIPPIGSIRAKTHIAPLKFTITLENIDISLLENLIENKPGKEEIMKKFKEKIYSIGKVFLIRLFFLAVLGGMAGSLLYRRKQMKPLLVGALVGILLYIILILGTLSTFDTSAFQNPEYRGMLEAAPWMMGLAEQAFIKLETLGEQLELMADNLYTLFEKISSMETLSSSEGSIKVLQVSDFHNNTAAMKFVKQIVNSFNVDLVIDTGDFTDYATPIEGQLIENLQDISIPYLFVPGNHDSPSIVEKISQIPKVTVMDEKVISVKGLTILGIQDPGSLTNFLVAPDKDAVNKYQEKLLALWNTAKKTPDIVAVHNSKIGDVLVNKAPLILTGHSHTYSVRKAGSTIVVNTGTTGAAGIRGLQATKEIPYTVVLLHFNKVGGGNQYKLTALDSIKVRNYESGFILERQVIND